MYKKGILLILFLLQTASATELISLFPLNKYDQNITNWIKPSDPDYNQLLLTPEQQRTRLTEFYNHTFSSDKKGFSPWSAYFVSHILQNKLPPGDIKTVEQDIIKAFNNNDLSPNFIRYGENYRPYPANWINKIEANMNINQFNSSTQYNAFQRGIMIDNTYARTLPTVDPVYYNPDMAGEGYPFDSAQQSAVWAGTPIYILGVTRDGGWYLILTPKYMAWVKSTTVARVDETFIKKWQKAALRQLGAIIDTETPIINDKNKLFQFYGYIGAVFPIVSKHAHQYKIMIPISDNHHRASITEAVVKDTEITPMPLSVTPHNMAIVMNNLLGRPHGWGNVYFYNDCSSTMISLYTPFGIWLLRHSNLILLAGKIVDMSKANVDERLDYLLKNGKKLMTLVYIGKHIFMYMGKYPKPNSPHHELMAMTFQAKWGLKIPNENTRVLIGKTVIFPLLKQYPENPKIESLANEEYFTISFLDQPPSYTSENLYLNFKNSGP